MDKELLKKIKNIPMVEILEMLNKTNLYSSRMGRYFC